MNQSTLLSSPLFESGIAAQPDGVVYSYFAYPGSLCLLPCGKLMAVFTAKKVQGPDESLAVYSDDGGQTWTDTYTLFGGTELSPSSTDLAESYGDPNLVVVDEKRVLAFCVSLIYAKGELDLRRTRFWRRISEDSGETFGQVEEMPRHRKYYVGTIHRGLALQNGSLLMGYSWDKPAEDGIPAIGEGGMDLRSGALISSDRGQTWTPSQDIEISAEKAAQHFVEATGGIVEPSIVELPDGRLFLLGRTPTNRLWQSFSHDGGLTWEQPVPSALVSHNCPAGLLRLVDDTVLVVYNNNPLERAHLSASLSTDGCQTWSEPKLLAPLGHPDREEASYPAPCELPDGTLLAVFGQIDRSTPDSVFNIRWVRFDRAFLSTAS